MASLDDLPFTLLTGVQRGAHRFSVLGAVGYPAGAAEVVRLEAYPSASKDAWLHFLSALDGHPQVIVCDEAKALLRAIDALWPPRSAQRPIVLISEWHYHRQLAGLLGLPIRNPHHPAWETPIGVGLRQAFWTLDYWEAFLELAHAIPNPRLRLWLDRKDAAIRRQFAQRTRLPRSTSAVEERLGQVRAHFGSRRGRFANRERMNRLLGLMALHMNGSASEARYARVIRTYLESRAGRAEPQNQINDPRGAHPSLLH